MDLYARSNSGLVRPLWIWYAVKRSVLTCDPIETSDGGSMPKPICSPGGLQRYSSKEVQVILDGSTKYQTRQSPATHMHCDRQTTPIRRAVSQSNQPIHGLRGIDFGQPHIVPCWSTYESLVGVFWRRKLGRISFAYVSYAWKTVFAFIGIMKN